MKFRIPFSKRTLVIIVTAILIISISFTIEPKANPNIFERAVAAVFLPIQSTVKWPYNKIKGSIDFFVKMKGYENENKRLMAENVELKEKVRQLEIDGIENEQLRDMLNLTKKYETSNAIVAEVISVDSTWFEVITVNKGKKDGIKENMTVLTPSGLVGKVTKVFDDYSQVTTILDVYNAVSASLTKTGDLVTTIGDMGLVKERLLKLKYVPSDILLAENDVIETSGMGGIYPRGIYIGTIKKVEEDSSLMKKYALIEPGVDFSKMREVLIIENVGESN